MNPTFWQNKTVFITGHTGFKGSWLTAWLQRSGARVVGYALPPPPPPTPSLFTVGRIGQSITSIPGDIRNFTTLAHAMAEHEPDIVIHLAAQALVKAAYADPVTTYTTNVIGTLSVLEAVRQTPSVRVVLSITSDKCYENSEWVWGYRENDRIGGRDPYSNSKACAELLTAAYRDSYFASQHRDRHRVRVATTRAGNVIGGGDWSADRLVPDIIRSITADEPVLIRHPHAIRPWQFVLEPLRGYLDLAERLWQDGESFVGAWNFGPDADHNQPVQWLVEYLTAKWGEGARWERDGATHPHEAHFLKLDSSKARSLLGWAPVLDLPTTLDWIVEWHQAYSANKDMRDVTDDQIARYEAIVAAAAASSQPAPAQPRADAIPMLVPAGIPREAC